MIDKLIEQQETIKGMQENEESAIKVMKMYEEYKLRTDKEIERLNNIINKALDKLNTQLAFTSNYQLNYQSAMYIIEEAKQILYKGE